MPSTPSSLLRIQLMGTGDQAGLWGNTTNTNLGTLLEGAIAGLASVSVISANQALTVVDYAADQSRMAIISLSTTTAANFNVYAPPVSKTYVIHNTSAYTATIYNSTVAGNTTAAGLGVTIPAGRIMQVWSNGTNFYKADTAITLSTDVTGTLPVANGGTGVTSSTGTGSVVLSTSPVLTTPNLGTPSAATLSNATGLPIDGGTTGTLPVNRGGTGATTLTGVLKGNGTSAVTASNVNLASEVTGALPIANGGTGQTTALAAFDALKQASTTTYVGAVELATTAEVQTGTDTTRAITPDALRQGALVRDTAQATTSGNVFNFTGIPSWVKRITFMFSGVSVTGTDSVLVQLGTSAGVTTTGYVSSAVGTNGTGGGTASSTMGFIIRAAGATGTLSGHMLITNITSNSWVSSHTLKTDNTGVVNIGGGDIALSGTLDRVRLTVTGSDTFDAGTVNIIYE